MQKTPHDEALTAVPASGHETSDLDARVVAVFGIALTTAIIVLMAVTYWIYDFTISHHAVRYPAAPPLAYTREPTPEPRLQVDAPRELRELRAAEDAALHDYAWVDKNRRMIRIPIDRAIDVLAQRGLPARVRAAPREGGEDKAKGQKK